MLFSSSKTSKWICCQIGAREHYAVPRALHQGGRLAILYTDFWAGPVTRKLSVGKLRPLAARFHPELKGQPALVQAWNGRGLNWELLLRRKFSEHEPGRSPYHGFLEVGRRFSRRVRDALQCRTDLNPDTIFFAYDTGALEALEWCWQNGIQTILNQMDPNRVEVDLVRAEEKQWPGWALQPIQVPPEYFVRREKEWATADRVLVNSEFSRQALIQQGVPPEKLVVVPLCYEANQPASADKGNIPVSFSSASPLRVLFLGQIILRKGIQYLLAAARQLERDPVHFDVVGPVGLSRGAISTAPANVTFHGRTGRDQIAGWYQRAHLFVLPTLSDGFAITQLEAMAHGLPVVATPCCGEVVSDGVDGFIVPPRDAAALAQSFRRYLAQPNLLTTQSVAASLKSRQFTLGRLATNLSALETALK